MNVIHFTLGSVDPDSSNGINRVVEGLAKSINESGVGNVSVVTIRKKMKRDNKKRETIKRDGFNVTTCCSIREAMRYLREIRSGIDIVHLHNAWSIENVVIGAWLARRKIPYILTPHAAFLPDRMMEKKWLKVIFHKAVQKNLLDRAEAIIAVSRDEMASIEQFTSNEHIKFVPNGSTTVDASPRAIEIGRCRPHTKLRFGYLGRISREKNIISLIRAVGLLPSEIKNSIQVLIYGYYENEYGRQCERVAHILGLESIVIFCGEVSGREKWIHLKNLDVYIQPSLSEAASISVLEAISQSLPIVGTRTSGLSYWHGNIFLQMVEPLAIDLARGLEEMVRKRDQLDEMGAAAYAFFEENFTWKVVSERYSDVYRECILSGCR